MLISQTIKNKVHNSKNYFSFLVYLYMMIKNKVHNSKNYFSFLVYLYMMFRLSTFYHFLSSSISIL